MQNLSVDIIHAPQSMLLTLREEPVKLKGIFKMSVQSGFINFIEPVPDSDIVNIEYA
ncbi:MAG: hypothetical protein Q8O41_05500 [Candidatus Methanoperedens sp.]|nr:hypothetical protein [Candidatus Methanoperedens sp.]